MRGLFLTIPPLAPDYSGVCAAFFEYNALMVLHDGGGCSGNYLCHDELRAQDFEHMVYTTNLRELEVVMGNDEAFLERVERGAADEDPKMMVLLNTPAPMVIGTDFRALAGILEKRTGKKTFYYNTDGIHFYDWGQKKALLDLVQTFSSAKLPYDGVTVLGATPLNIGESSNADALRQIIRESTGLSARILGMGDTEEALDSLGNSRLNIVVSPSAVPAAKWCEKTYGTPWITACPVGESGIREMAELIGSRLFPETVQTACDIETGIQIPGKNAGRRALVVHEQIIANGFRNCLLREFGYTSVDVASFFEMDPAFSQTGDLALAEEDDFIEAVRNGAYDEVYCDHLLHDTLRDIPVKLIDLPHLAVCGVLCYPVGFPMFGKEAADRISGKLG